MPTLGFPQGELYFESGMATSKEEKEAFVSGLDGTSVAEVNLLTTAVCAGFLLRCTLLICFPLLYVRTCNQPLFSILLDFGTIIFPGILVVTVLADYSFYLLSAELIIIGATLVNTFYWSWKQNKHVTNSLLTLLATPYPKRQPYLTLTRTFVNLITAIAILAVDFRMFPRRLAKTETFGSGLMDIGVGAFLMAHGVTAPEVRQSQSSGLGTMSLSYLKLVMATMKQVFPLLLLGLFRVIIIKFIGYQEHASEYGTHWNFFFTIATVRVRKCCS